MWRQSGSQSVARIRAHSGTGHASANCCRIAGKPPDTPAAWRWDHRTLTQQTVQAYEVGRRRIQVSALPVVARALSVSLEELPGEGKPAARSKRGPTPKWEQQIEAISKLPRARQRFVSEMLDTVLAQH